MAGPTPRGSRSRKPASFSHPAAPAHRTPQFADLIGEAIRHLQRIAADRPPAPVGWSGEQCTAYLQRFTLGGADPQAVDHPEPRQHADAGHRPADEASPEDTPDAVEGRSALDAATSELHGLGGHLRLLAGLCPTTPGARVDAAAAMLSEHLHDLAERARAASAHIEALPRSAGAAAQHDAASLHAGRLAAALRTIADATGLQPTGSLNLTAEDLATTLAELGDRARQALGCLDALSHRPTRDGGAA